MNFKHTKYKHYFYTEPDGTKVVVAVSSFAGHKVKGYAKCSPDDKYDETAGKRLAEARCQKKISSKRRAYAARKYLEAIQIANEAQNHFFEMKKYFMDADDDCDEAEKELAELLKNF